MIAHRGASLRAPENTIKAYSKAIDLGVEMIELDVHMTHDNQLVCIHDRELNRTTDGIGLINELTLEEIQSFDAGDGEVVPTLEDVLVLCKDRIMVDIELKAIDIEKDVLSVVEKHNMLDKVIFSSFYHGSLLVLKELSGLCKTAILVNKPIEDLIGYAKSIQANAINPKLSLLDSNLAEELHNASLQIYPWTVNTESDATRVLSLGIDGLITDDPEMMQRIIAQF